jgi:DMSO/TMAO reductase YedYZ molybdopterin-dependent catalytic subunit
MNATDRLPPGQQALEEFPRFGLPATMRKWPQVPARPTVSIEGDVEEPCEVSLDEIGALEHTRLESDLHCVATWSRLGLRWDGVRFRDFCATILVPRARPRAEARWVRFRGLDGHFASLALDDALAPDVLLAAGLDGAPLTPEHGAPLRLVAPAHYGYKSVKHLSGIELRRRFSPKRFTPLGWTEHPRARALLEERGRGKPGPALRSVYAAMLPDILRAYRPFAHPPAPGAMS